MSEEQKNNISQIRKGFRQQRQPTKGEVQQENQTLAVELQNEVKQLKMTVQFMGNMLGQLMNQLRNIAPEVDALSTLEASVTMPISEAARKGDLVMIDYTGVLLKDDGTADLDENGMEKRFQGGSGLKFVVRGLGTGQLIPGFEESLEGKKPGDTFEVDTEFPENYGVKDLAKRKVKFLITVHRINRMLPFSPVEKVIREYEGKRAEILKAKSEAAKTEAEKAKENSN